MKKTILIVDDFENSLFVTGLTLQNNGYTVLKAGSGAEALNHLKGQPINLIITDYRMPEMNGLELVQQIKRSVAYQRTPIFVLSTEIKQEIKDYAANLGVTAWIQKPFKIEQLLKLIERAIS